MRTRPVHAMKRTTAPSVLIVEDDETMRLTLLLQLQHLGVRADCVGGGIDALKCIHKASYKLILMDLILPDQDGFVTIKSIRTWESTQNKGKSTIIVISSYEDGRRASLQAGADTFLPKPVMFDKMRTIVDTWLGGVGPPLSLEKCPIPFPLTTVKQRRGYNQL